MTSPIVTDAFQHVNMRAPGLEQMGRLEAILNAVVQTARIKVLP
jgi:hypothetical protein